MKQVIFCMILSNVALTHTQAVVTCDPTPRANYSTEQRSYFSEIALGAEYGDVDAVIHKWPAGTTVSIHGNFTAEDQQLIEGLVGEINRIVEVKLLEFSQDASDITIYVLPGSEFRSYEPNYVDGNDGFFWFYWSADNNLYKATVLIDENLESPWREHLIREEFTQALGLANDSYRYEESIFYQPYTSVTKYLPIDRTVIEMLYRCDVFSGMAYDELPSVLK